MKLIPLVLLFFVLFFVQAQIPPGYYNSATDGGYASKVNMEYSKNKGIKNTKFTTSCNYFANYYCF